VRISVVVVAAALTVLAAASAPASATVTPTAKGHCSAKPGFRIPGEPNGRVRVCFDVPGKGNGREETFHAWKAIIDATRAGDHIYLALFQTGSAGLERAVRNATNRHVHVEIVVDSKDGRWRHLDGMFHGKYAHVRHCRGCFSGAPTAKMHNKILITTSAARPTVLATGSANRKHDWSGLYNDMLIFTGTPDLFREYLGYFASLWRSALHPARHGKGVTQVKRLRGWKDGHVFVYPVTSPVDGSKQDPLRSAVPIDMCSKGAKKNNVVWFVSPGFDNPELRSRVNTLHVHHCTVGVVSNGSMTGWADKGIDFRCVVPNLHSKEIISSTVKDGVQVIAGSHDFNHKARASVDDNMVQIKHIRGLYDAYLANLEGMHTTTSSTCSAMTG
jgi:hypothetical protein